VQTSTYVVGHCSPEVTIKRDMGETRPGREQSSLIVGLCTCKPRAATPRHLYRNHLENNNNCRSGVYNLCFQSLFLKYNEV